LSTQSNKFRIQLKWQSILIMGILFSLLLIYILYIGVDDVISSLFQANILLLLFAIIVYYSSIFIRSYRWKLFLNSLKFQNSENISYWSIYSLITYSFSLNNLFPLRMGEFYRPYELSKKTNYKLVSSFATIILERTLDIIFMASLILITAVLQGMETVLNESEIFLNLVLSVSIIGFFIFLLLILSREKPIYLIMKFLNFISGFVQKKLISDEERTAQEISTEISKLIKNRRVIILGCLTSLTIWLMEGFVFWIVCISMKIDISIIMAIFILLFAGLIGNSITSASGLGQLPFMIAQLVLLVGITDNLALSTCIVYLVIVFWMIIPIGTFFHELEKVIIKSNLISKKSDKRR